MHINPAAAAKLKHVARRLRYNAGSRLHNLRLRAGTADELGTITRSHQLAGAGCHSLLLIGFVRFLFGYPKARMRRQKGIDITIFRNQLVRWLTAAVARAGFNTDNLGLIPSIGAWSAAVYLKLWPGTTRSSVSAVETITAG